MASERYIDHHVRLTLDVNDFTAMVGGLPSRWRQIFAGLIEGLDVDVLHGGTNVGEAPGNPLVVSHDHVGQTGQSDASGVEVAAAEMGFVPQVRHLVPEVHVVREQRLARNRVRAGNHPVIGTDHHAGVGIRFRCTREILQI